jgi:sec-independent protein translocase protein TatC
MYANEKRYVVPFMAATIGLFLAGAWFGYHWVLPGAIKVLVLDFGKKFNPILTIEDYTQFFLAVILGLGICFELPILIFFLALFGIVDAKFLIRHIRYAVLVIFLISAIICPLPDPFSMILFASPMLVLYFLGVGVAFFVHPSRRKAKEAKKAA